MMVYADKMQNCAEYVEALEVERRKIQVFERELPLCLELVSQAIDACRQQLSSSATECSEQTSSHGPVLEFIPIKPAASACSSKDGSHEEESGKKSDWLRSVHLWNQSSDPAPEVKGNGAFRPFNKERVVAAEAVDNEPASSGTKKVRKEEIKTENESALRKQRRCWSPELHRRFIHALQQLGGANVATPKQIKELMKVDGLTNDEVKSHLQKYRLHMKRPSYTMSSNDNTQGPQFVVVGGIWVPPTSPGDQPEANSGKKEASSPNNGVYAPVAKVGTPFARPASKPHNNNHEDQSGSHCIDDGSHSPHQRSPAQAVSSSPASSSSTHTTATATASPVSS